MSEYRYPTGEEIERNLVQETAAITTAVASMADALESCPLKDSLKVYAIIELALKYGRPRYVEEVLGEFVFLRGGK